MCRRRPVASPSLLLAAAAAIGAELGLSLLVGDDDWLEEEEGEEEADVFLEDVKRVAAQRAVTFYKGAAEAVGAPMVGEETDVIVDSIRRECTRPSGLLRAYGVAAILELGFLTLAAFFVLGRPCGNILMPGSSIPPDEQLRQVALLFLFGTNLMFTIVVPDSLYLAASYGRTPAYSGHLIGIFKLVQVPGAIGMWYYYRKGPTVWVDTMRRQLVIFSMLLLAGSLLYWIAASRSRPKGFFWMLIAGRCVAGVGGGMSAQLARHVMARTVAAKDRQRSLTRLNFAVILGIGFGPLAGPMAMDAYLSICDSGANGIQGEVHASFEVTGQSQVIVSTCLLLLTLFRLPSAEQVKRATGDVSRRTSSESGSVRRGVEAERQYSLRRKQICFCIFVATARGMTVAGLESALAMVLERGYGWNSAVTGTVVSGTFLMLVPVRFLYDLVGEAGLHFRLRMLVFTCIVSTLPLFQTPHVGLSIGDRIALLLASCSMFFPCIFLTSGAVEGFMLRNALPIGSWFALDNLILLQTVCTDGFGRYAGPPLARYELDRWGQDAYASHQLAVMAAAALAVEGVLQLQKRIDVVPFLRNSSAGGGGAGAGGIAGGSGSVAARLNTA